MHSSHSREDSAEQCSTRSASQSGQTGLRSHRLRGHVRGASLALRCNPRGRGGTMSNRSRFLAVLTLSLAMSAGALAQETLKIGAPQPMTGPDAPFGDKFKKAYSMAVEEINAKGGIDGRKIEVLIEDHQAKNPLAATVAEKLITQEKVLVLTGGRASGQAVEIASVAQRLKTPYLVDHPSADIITAKGFDWVFRNNPTGSIYPQAFNKFINAVPGVLPPSVAI